MADSYRRLGSLAALGLEARAMAPPVADAGVRLSERAPRDQLTVRGDAGSARFAGAVAAVAVELPVEANTCTTRGDAVALWLGPDEWLLVVPPGRGADVAGELARALGDEHFAVSDVSHSRVALRMSGPHARDVLAKGCPLDVHPRAFGPGRCAQSTLAKTHALIHQVDDGPSFDVYVHRSFARYAWEWLEDAADEYGVEVGGAA